MARYDYKCQADNFMVTINRGMTEEEILPYCDFCNTPMKRIYEAVPVKFNATGFYSTGG